MFRIVEFSHDNSDSSVEWSVHSPRILKSALKSAVWNYPPSPTMPRTSNLFITSPRVGAPPAGETSCSGLAGRLLLWPAADRMNCRVQEKCGTHLPTPHLHSHFGGALPQSAAVLYVSKCQSGFFFNSSDSCLPRCCLSRSLLAHLRPRALSLPRSPILTPCHGAVLLAVLSKRPQSHTWRSRDTNSGGKGLKYTAEGSAQGPIPHHPLHRQ